MLNKTKYPSIKVTNQVSDPFSESIMKNFPHAFALCKMVSEPNDQCDFIFVEVNKTFEELIGRNDISGIKYTEILPDIKNPEILFIFKEVASGQKSRIFSSNVFDTDQLYKITAYCPEKGYCAAIFEELSHSDLNENNILVSESPFKQLLDISQEAISIHYDGKIQYVNKAAVHLIGAKSASELIGQSVIQFVHPDDREIVIKRIQDVLNNNREATLIKEKFLKLDGKVVDVEVIATAFSFNNKPAVLVLIHDITRRENAEKALKESENKYEKLVENAGEGIMLVQDGKLKLVNKRVLGITGYTRNEIESKLFTEFIYPDDVEKALDIHKRRLNYEEVPSRYTLRLLDKNKRVRWVDVMGSTIEWQSKPASLIFISDITEKKQAELALIKSENINRTLIEHLPQRLFIKDLKSRYILANENYARDLGIKPEEIIGKSDYNFFPKEYADKFRKDDRNVIREGVIVHLVEKYLIKKERRWTYVIKVPYRNSEGKIIGVLGIFEDITERKLEEEALKESQARFKMAFTTSPDSIIINRLKDGVFTDANKGFLSLSGYSSREVIGKSFDDIKIWHSTSEKEFMLQKLKNNGYIQNFETRLIKKNGEILHALISAAIIKFNNIPHNISIIHDITERKNTESALQLFRSLVDESSDIIWVVDPESGRILDINEQACREYGYTRNELLCMHIFDINPYVTKQDFKKDVLRIKKSDSYLIQGIHRRKDGSLLPVEINLKYVRNDKKYVVAVIRNVTSRKQLEQDLLLQSAALHAAANAIVITDIQGNILQINKAFTNLTGYKVNETIGSNPRDLVKSGKHDSSFYRKMWDTILSGNTWRGNLINRKKNGKFYHEEMTITPVKNENGNIKYFIAIKQNIDGRIKSERKIQSLNTDLGKRIKQRTEQLENANKELEAFAYSVSHDLRAPLRSIAGFSGILMEDYHDNIDEAGQDLLNRVNRNVHFMSELIDDLLEFSRLGRTKLSGNKIKMYELVQSIINEQTEEQNHRKFDIRLQKLYPIKGDQNMIKQVWVNLISNAIKYSNKRKVIRIEIGSEKSENEVIYFIKDNGIGFDMKYYDKLFDVFQRLHNNQNYEGTGVGLALVKRIISRHGGRIWAEGMQNKGAEFYFTIPLI